MRRWLAIALGLALAGAAALGWHFVRGREAGVSAGPHADIDPASRAALEKILEESDRNGGREPPGRTN